MLLKYHQCHGSQDLERVWIVFVFASPTRTAGDAASSLVITLPRVSVA